MKKFVLATSLAMAMLLAVPTVSMAATKNYMSSDKSVKEDAELRGSSAPYLTFEATDQHTGDMYFVLNLDNAEWLYEGTGNIATGVSYNVLTPTQMIIEVDHASFQPDINDLSISMETKVLGAGVATVTVDPKSSTVSAGTYAFAHVSFPAMAISVNSVDEEDGSFDITFKDDYPYLMGNGRLFKLTLSNDFLFDSYSSAEGTGKYAGKVEMTIDKTQKIAYVQLDSASAISTGTMKINGIKVSPTDKSVEGSTYVYVEPVYGEGGTLSFPLNDYKPEESAPQEVVRTDRQVLFTIGQTGYTVDKGYKYTTDAAPFIDANGRTMLPLRALANAFNISDENIKWDDETKTVELTNKEGKLIIVTVGDTTLKVGDAKVTMDTTAVIKESRTYLPMRAVLNALGVADDDIVWDDKEKTVLVYDKEVE